MAYVRYSTEIKMTAPPTSLLSKLQILESGYFRPIGSDGSGIFRTKDGVGVAIPWASEELIFLKYQSVELRIEHGLVPNNDHSKHLALFLTKEKYLRIFCVMATDFLSLERRTTISSSPSDWWEEWCGMLGNSIRKELPQAVFGELFAYWKILQVDKNSTWSSLELGIQDIISTHAAIEVKTTLKRYAKTVEISSENQLFSQSENLYLLFIRLTKDPSSSLNIDSLIKSITSDFPYKTDLGESIECYLSQYGLADGAPGRRLRFSILDCEVAKIDSNFPRLHPGLMIDGRLPDGISHIKYDVNLDVVPRIRFDDFLSNGLAWHEA